ncbi:unnamed protein product, partial [Gongylonema pulchrum]|uniref:Anillin domain-containing protein n=1 Tax=Gongylonema pulchrum TaxID=637853 RepID=A0A183ES33_9BILA
MFVVLQATSNVIDSGVVSAVDRSCTDVVFTDSFIFENQPVDFEIEIQLYSARTDGGDMNQSFKQKLTRSLGRRLGAAYKSGWLGEDALALDRTATHSDAPPDGMNNVCFHLLGRTKLTLSDARPRTGIYDLHLSPNAANYGPPLYGHIRCRIVAQPNSVAIPLSDGILTIKPVGEDRLYQNMRCRLQVINALRIQRNPLISLIATIYFMSNDKPIVILALQAGVLRCVATHWTQAQEQALLHIYINKVGKCIANFYKMTHRCAYLTIFWNCLRKDSVSCRRVLLQESKLLTCMHRRSIIVTSDRYLAGTKRDKQYIL